MEIDTIGTVSQGVVTYNVKIGFDTQDERVKPGMSVSTDIITDVRQDVLMVPNSAIKSSSYVEALANGQPVREPVEIGLSNNTMTEIISGLNEGDKIRISMPKMTEENRKEIVKKLNEKQEHCRISLRQVRDEIKGDIEKAEKDKEIAEDDKYKFIKELDDEIGKYNNSLKEIRDKKETDIMTI